MVDQEPRKHAQRRREVWSDEDRPRKGEREGERERERTHVTTQRRKRGETHKGNDKRQSRNGVHEVEEGKEKSRAKQASNQRIR